MNCLLVALVLALQGQEVDIQLPVKERVLKNGMRVLAVRKPDAPRVFCALYWRVRSWTEPTLQ